jgi:hypothetical protein
MSTSGRRPSVPSGREAESGSDAREDSLGGWQMKGSPESLPVEHNVPRGVWSGGSNKRGLEEGGGGGVPDLDEEGGGGGGL